MTNPSTVGEDFQVDGQSLYTLAFSVWTLAGREQAPPIVGDNIAIPYRNNRIWTPKYFDQRTITLGMWVKGTDQDGNLPDGFATPMIAARAQFNENLRTLKRLFAPRDQQLSLSRTLQFTTGLETHTALGDAYNPSSGGFSAGGGGLGTDQWDLVPVTSWYGTFTIDVVMADPWWYGTQIGVGVSWPTPTVITNVGDVLQDHPVITLAGPLTNPVVTNTLTPNVSVTYNGTIGAGHFVTVDCGAFTAFDDLGNSVTGNVTHAGSLFWMIIEPGSNTFTLTDTVGGSPGSGFATVTFSPPYI